MSCFPLHRGVPVKDIVDKVPYVANARTFKEGNRVADSHRMIRMSDGERCEKRWAMLHFKLEIMPDKLLLAHISYPVRAFVPKLIRCLLEI